MTPVSEAAQRIAVLNFGRRIAAGCRYQSTVLLVEQNAGMGLSVADHGYVPETGRIVPGGKPDALWGDEAIAAAYLGDHAKVTV